MLSIPGSSYVGTYNSCVAVSILTHSRTSKKKKQYTLPLRSGAADFKATLPSQPLAHISKRKHHQAPALIAHFALNVVLCAIRLRGVLHALSLCDQIKHTPSSHLRGKSDKRCSLQRIQRAEASEGINSQPCEADPIYFSVPYRYTQV